MATKNIKQRAYSIAEKLNAVKRVKELSGNLSAASRELGIDRKRLREWRNKESEFTNMTDKRRKRRIGGGRHPMHAELKNKLCRWVSNQRSKKIIVNYRLLREQAFAILAEEVSASTSSTDFVCSNRWIKNFMRRNGLSFRKITHMGQADNKSAKKKSEIARDYLNSINDLTIGLDPHQIFNMDETPIYIDMVSSSTIDFVGKKNIEAAHCGSNKTRLTAVLCINASGQILQTMVILKGLKKVPNVKIPKNIFLAVASKGTMNCQLMKTWITNVFNTRPSQFFSRDKKAILFMDEFSVHKKTEILEMFERQNTMVKFIPPKTTAYLQPLDVAVNAQFKSALRSEWGRWFEHGEKEYTAKGYRKRPSYQQIINFVSNATAALKKESLIRSFECCGIAANGEKISETVLHSRLQDVINMAETECEEEEEENETDEEENETVENSDDDNCNESNMVTDEEIREIFASDESDDGEIDFEGFQPV